MDGRGAASAPPLSVVVPTRDRPAHLAACLDALAAALRPGDELIVVDSASTDPAVGDVARAHGARVVRCTRAGTSRARNAGAMAATHNLVAYVDDDVRVEGGWAAALAAALSDPTVAFVTGRVAVPDHQRGLQREVAIKDDDAPAVLDASSPSPLGSSASLAIRRAALVAIGGFDEALGGGAPFEAGEDLDLYDRLFAAGHEGRYEPQARAWHDQWRSRSQLLRLDWRYGIGAGARLSKLIRLDRPRARRAAREVLWDDGLQVLGRALRSWQEFLVVTTVLRIAGTVTGFVLGLCRRLHDGCFASPASFVPGGRCSP